MGLKVVVAAASMIKGKRGLVAQKVVMIALALIALVILSYIFMGPTKTFGEVLTGCEKQGHKCEQVDNCPDMQQYPVLKCPNQDGIEQVCCM